MDFNYQTPEDLINAFHNAADDAKVPVLEQIEAHREAWIKSKILELYPNASFDNVSLHDLETFIRYLIQEDTIAQFKLKTGIT